MRLAPHAIAKLLERIYRLEFGSKEKGRYIVKREDLRHLAGRSKLEQSIIDKIAYECFDLGLYFLDLEDSFGLVRIGLVKRWRKVPSRVINEFVPAPADEKD